MPELPEVETVRQGLEARLKDRVISEVQVRMPKIIKGDAALFAERAVGKRVVGLERKGKIYLIDLGDYLIAGHLKMTGKYFFVAPGTTPEKHSHVVFRIQGADFEVHYNDLRQFGWLALLTPEELADFGPWSDLGPDALAVSEREFTDRLARRRGRLKPLLLNQNFLAGLGNIYVDEALFQAGLHPLRRAETLKPAERKRLHKEMIDVLSRALAAGGSTIADFQDAEGNLGYFQHQHKVYQKTGRECPVCKSEIKKIKLGGRSTHFCPGCQLEE